MVGWNRKRVGFGPIRYAFKRQGQPSGRNGFFYEASKATVTECQGQGCVPLGCGACAQQSPRQPTLRHDYVVVVVAVVEIEV